MFKYAKNKIILVDNTIARLYYTSSIIKKIKCNQYFFLTARNDVTMKMLVCTRVWNQLYLLGLAFVGEDNLIFKFFMNKNIFQINNQ